MFIVDVTLYGTGSFYFSFFFVAVGSRDSNYVMVWTKEAQGQSFSLL
jgi:hypothetical protein